MKLDSLVTVLLVVTALVFATLYVANRLSINALIYVEITLALAILALLLPTDVNRSKIKEVPTFRIPFSLWLLPVAVFTVSEVEILLLRRTGLGYVAALAAALTVTAFAREKSMKKVMVATAIVGASLVQLYTLYVPSFGNDTWRDIIWAAQALQAGHVTESTVRHSAYPFPMVPLEYALVSLMSGLDPAWASVVMGLLYLVQLPLLVFLLSRRFGGSDDFRGAFILLTVPLVVIWSAWYIPQVYSLTASLTAFLAGSLPLQLLLLAAGVFGHGGVATWMVLATAALWISKRGRETAAMLFNLIIIFAAYATYTSLLYALSGAYDSVVEAVLAFLRGEKILAATAPASAPPTSSLSILALSVLVVSGLLVFLHGRGPARALAFLSGTFLIVAYVGVSAFPAADLSRYLGLPSAAMLAVFAPYAFELLRRRRYGALYSLLLVAVAVFSFAYSGVFAPRNPYTNNPYGLSLSGLISYGDAQQIRTISQMLAPGTYLTDWRSGHFMADTYLDIQPQYRGFRYKGIEFIYGGSYGLYIDSTYLQRFSGLIILRQGSSDMPGVWSAEVFGMIREPENSVLYSSNGIVIWARGS
jgi:hypothetical protein